MDLIYANDSFEDVGVMQDYTMDMAYGLDENDFVIEKALQAPECEAGYYVYVEGTEFGGIIDAIGADTVNGKLTYEGRTWHGILATKVIEPDEGYSHYSVGGDANEIIAEIIERCGLGEIFEASSDPSDIDIPNYDFRYTDVNSGLFYMLNDNGGKLVIKAKNGRVILSAEQSMNYAALEELDSSQIEFSLKQTFIHCNHLICLGQGEKENRYVIHLFTDEGGGVLPYAYTDDPIKDSDYILDRRKIDDPEPGEELLLGKDEYTEVYDYSNASFTDNYEMLDTEPDDWKENYSDYYEKAGDESDGDEEEEGDQYNQIARNIQDVYTPLSAQPDDWESNTEAYFTHSTDPQTGEDVYDAVSVPTTDTYQVATVSAKDWNKKYKNYYYKDGNDYKQIEKIAQYTKLSKKPRDWAKKYKNYYVRIGNDWQTVSGASKNKYDILTRKPSDWHHGEDWKDYYIIRTVNGKSKHIKMGDDETLKRRKNPPRWKKNTYYVQRSITVTPKYSSTMVYYSKKMVVPTFSKYAPKYKKTSVRNVPTFTAGTYYRLDADVDLGVEFIQGSYFKQVTDHYAELVAGGIDRLGELNTMEQATVDVKDQDISYDIGDIIGGSEEVTGIHIEQPVVKKIVKIEHDLATIRYEVEQCQ